MIQEKTRRGVILFSVPANETPANTVAREVARQAATDMVAVINKKRQEKKPPGTHLNAQQVVDKLVPSRPVDDIGFILGTLDNADTDEIRSLGVKKKGLERLIHAVTTAAAYELYTTIWRPRCDAVAEQLGSWHDQLNARRGRPESTNDVGDNRVRRSTTRPRECWLRANERMGTEYYCAPVEPSWQP